MSSALSDITILDLSRVLAGPYATMLLGDFGATVLKVEQPSMGDDTRRWGPPFTASGQSAYFLSANRNKRSITLNLKSTAGREVLRELVRRCDVLVENFRVGMMEGLSLDYSSLREIKPELIYLSISGYGQNGPDRDRPGYDTIIQAQGGLMSITGPTTNGRDGEPMKVGVAITDVMTGMHAATAILAALHHRQRTGEGQHIDLALFDVQLSWLVNVASSYLVSGQPPRRHGNAHASIVPYQAFPTADGWLMVAVGNDRQFANFSAAFDYTNWASDERFATNPARVAHREILVPQIEAVLRTKSTQHWLDKLQAAGVPCAPVNDIPTALNTPQAQARNMVQHVAHPVDGAVPQLGPVAKMSGTPPRIQSAPPHLGEHTDEILREMLGYDEERIRRLREMGAI